MSQLTPPSSPQAAASVTPRGAVSTSGATVQRLREDLIHPDPLLDCLVEICRLQGPRHHARRAVGRAADRPRHPGPTLVGPGRARRGARRHGHAAAAAGSRKTRRRFAARGADPARQPGLRADGLGRRSGPGAAARDRTRCCSTDSRRSRGPFQRRGPVRAPAFPLRCRVHRSHRPTARRRALVLGRPAGPAVRLPRRALGCAADQPVRAGGSRCSR